MRYKLRFVQEFEAAKKRKFLDLEKQFIQLEKRNPDLPSGTRYIPLSGLHSENTLIWECDFESLTETINTLELIKIDANHDRLFQEQVQYFKDSYVEIYKVLE